ncbi:MAG: hypothetical protein PHO28_02030 [Candidatus Pacebacteria bacterium]|nr:hypothetical protein [Candidatus Paceibacterota bacterium]
MKQEKITYKEFMEGYKAGKFELLVNRRKAGDFVLSDFADKHNKPAHIFWSWSGILLIMPLPIVFIFINWVWSIVSFVLGILIINASKKSAGEFVFLNMLNDETFWNYVLIHGGAIIKDNKGNIYLPKN